MTDRSEQASRLPAPDRRRAPNDAEAPGARAWSTVHVTLDDDAGRGHPERDSHEGPRSAAGQTRR